MTIPRAIEIYDETLRFLTEKLTIAPRTQGRLNESREEFIRQLSEPRAEARTLDEVHALAVQIAEGQRLLSAYLMPPPPEPPPPPGT